MQSRGCFASAFALKTFNGVKLCGHLLWSEASMLHKDIYICCMENCGILNVAVILCARMWIEMVQHASVAAAAVVILCARMWIEIAYARKYQLSLVSHPLCEDVD